MAGLGFPTRDRRRSPTRLAQQETRQQNPVRSIVVVVCFSTTKLRNAPRAIIAIISFSLCRESDCPGQSSCGDDDEIVSTYLSTYLLFTIYCLLTPYSRLYPAWQHSFYSDGDCRPCTLLQQAWTRPPPATPSVPISCS